MILRCGQRKVTSLCANRHSCCPFCFLRGAAANWPRRWRGIPSLRGSILLKLLAAPQMMLLSACMDRCIVVYLQARLLVMADVHLLEKRNLHSNAYLIMKELFIVREAVVPYHEERSGNAAREQASTTRFPRLASKGLKTRT